MPISTRNRVVLRVPQFSSNFRLVRYDADDQQGELKCFFSLSASDRQFATDTIVISFYDMHDIVLYQVMTEMPKSWHMQDYLKALHCCILFNNNSITVLASKNNGKKELGEIPAMNEYLKYDSERLKKILRWCKIDSYFSGGM